LMPASMRTVIDTCAIVIRLIIVLRCKYKQFISFCHQNGEYFHQLGWNLFIFVQLIAHAVLDVVVNDEVEFLLREAVVLGKDFVDFVDDGFGLFL